MPVSHAGLPSWARQAAVAWLAVWTVTAAVLALTGFASGDPDSQLYAGISARLVVEPVRLWIAPEWWGFWNSTGPYAEHPVGMFVVPALLGRLGYPPLVAAYAVNAWYQCVVFFLAALLGRTVMGARNGAALAWTLQLLPIAFVFRVRANQEYAVLAGVVLALYATERARTRPGWTAGMLAGFTGVLLVKGVFALMVPVCCAGWLIARDGWRGVRSVRTAWAATVAMPVAGAAVAALYEWTYVQVTGRSFLALYQSRQLPEDALQAGSLAARTAYTAVWYVARVLWYAFPWSLVALAATAKALADRRWRRPVGEGEDTGASARQGAWFAIVTAVALTAAFSLAHRKADRYIFPVYFLIGAAGAGIAAHRSPAFGRLVARLDRPWTGPALYLTLFLISMITRGHLPILTFWRT